MRSPSSLSAPLMRERERPNNDGLSVLIHISSNTGKWHVALWRRVGQLSLHHTNARRYGTYLRQAHLCWLKDAGS